jgi:hypothetical protein
MSLLPVNPPLVHPGSRTKQRITAVPTGLRHFKVPLTGTQPFETEILQAFQRAGCASGAVEINDLECEALEYVVPVQSQVPERLAWYSPPRAPTGPATIRQGYASVGRNGNKGMIHCHGIWSQSDRPDAIGHLLGQQTRAFDGQVLNAIGFDRAVFDRRSDPETNFDLFVADETGNNFSQSSQALVVTLRPNVDIPTTCSALCSRFGWKQARVMGLGSLNGAGFAHGSIMMDYISEFVIRQGRVTPKTAEIDIAVVDRAGTSFQGVLEPGRGCVSITSELVLLAESDRS